MNPLPSPSLKIPDNNEYANVFHFTNVPLNTGCLLLSCKVSVFVHWRLQVPTLNICKLNVAPGSASELFVMSRVMLVGC